MFAYVKSHHLTKNTVFLLTVLIFCLPKPLMARVSLNPVTTQTNTPILSKTAIIKHLRLSHFDRLEQSFSVLTTRYLESKASAKAQTEKSLALAYAAFQYGDPSLTPQYNRWVHRSPGKVTPLMARAIHFWRLGWFARGTKWGSETPPKRFEEMESYFHQAHKDLVKVLQLNPKLSVAWGYRLNMMNTLSHSVSWQAEGLEKLYYVASAHAPHSVIIPDNYFMRLQPRWGGSRARILTALERLKLLRTNEPETKYLFGFLHYAVGHNALSSKRYRKALQAFESAGKFGISARYLRAQSRAYYGIKDYKHALIAIDRANKMEPQAPQNIAFKARILWRLNKRNAALDLWEEASNLSPYDPEIGSWYGYALKEKGYFNKALFVFRRSQFFDQQNHEIYALQGNIQLYHTKNFAQAAINFARALTLDPDNINYLFSQGSALYMAKRAKEAAPLLRQYARYCNSPVHQCRKNQIAWVNKTFCSKKEEKLTCGLPDPKQKSFAIRFLKWLY